MALEKWQGVGTDTQPGRHSIHAVDTKTVKFVNSAGAELLGPGVPVGQRTSDQKWFHWDPAAVDGTEVIRAFVAPVAENGPETTDGVQLDATNDVLGVVMWEGKIHISDVDLTHAGNQTQFEAEARSGNLRAWGIDVLGTEGMK